MTGVQGFRRCLWPDCQRYVPGRYFGCHTHWRKLPAAIKASLWDTYNAGVQPSPAHAEALANAQAWIADYVSKVGPIVPPDA